MSKDNRIEKRSSTRLTNIQSTNNNIGNKIKKDAQILDFSNSHLTKVPKEINFFSNPIQLILNENNLKEINSEELPLNLRTLKVSMNEISQICCLSIFQ